MPVERSRSGKGIHFWLFFDENIPASTARKFGSSLITYAMNKHHELSFKTYDRLIPTQDSLPKGGFGNLIALPLQKQPRAQGNNVFVDENFIAYLDQWSYLFQIRKYTLAEVEQFTRKLSPAGDLGELQNVSDSDDEKPWESKPTGTKSKLAKTDFPDKVSIVHANILYVEKSGISSPALNALKRLAAFRNPAFYKAQAMRLPTHNKPRIIDCSIVDECHRVAAFSFEQILKAVNAKYVYGLTATPTRKEGHHPIIYMHCGKIRYRVDAKQQAEERPFEHYLIPRFTRFQKPAHRDGEKWKIYHVYSDIQDNELRINLIVQDVINAVNQGRNPIILTERTDHVAILTEKLKSQIKNVIPLTGGMSQKQSRETLQMVANIPNNEPFVLVATGKYIGEGFDMPRLDTLFLAMPISWSGTVQQYAGRLHRLLDGKEEVQIYDYVDVHVSMLEKMHRKRLRSYASIGYKVKDTATAIEQIHSIYKAIGLFTA